MKKLFLIGLLTVFSVSGLRFSAQNVTYTYDNAGNRISRQIIALRSSSGDASSLDPLLDYALEQEIKFYPNPTKGILTVEFPSLSDDSQGEIQIIDMSGRTVKHMKNISRQNTFDLSGQANGIYLLQIRHNEETATWKIIKQ